MAGRAAGEPDQGAAGPRLPRPRAARRRRHRQHADRLPARRWPRTRSTRPPCCSARRRARGTPAPATTRRRSRTPRRGSRCGRAPRAGDTAPRRPGVGAARGRGRRRTGRWRGPARWRCPGWAATPRRSSALAELAARAAARRGGAAGAAALRGGDGGPGRGAGPVRGVPPRAARRARHRPRRRRCRPCTGELLQGDGAGGPARRRARAQPAARPRRRHRRGGRPAAHVPGHLDRRAGRAGQDPARARRQPAGGAAGRALRRARRCHRRRRRGRRGRRRPSACGEAGAPRPARRRPADVLAGIVDALGAGPALLVLDNCEHVVARRRRAGAGAGVDDQGPAGADHQPRPARPVVGVGVPAAGAGPADDGRAVRPAGPGGPPRRRAARRRGRGAVPPPGRAAARGGAGRGAGAGDVGRRDRPPAGRPVRPAARRRRGTRRSGTAPCTPSSTGAGTCSSRPGRRRCARCRSSPTGSPPTPRGALLGDDALPSWSTWSTSRCSRWPTPPSGTRFRMLETVREFSAARREEAGETDRGRPTGSSPGPGTSACAHHESTFGADPYVGHRADPGRAGQPGAGAALGLDRRDGATVAATAGVLGGLWIVESNYTRLAGAGRGDRLGAVALPARARPRRGHPDGRGAVRDGRRSSCPRPRPLRALVALRRLPPAAAGHPDPGRRPSCCARSATPAALERAVRQRRAAAGRHRQRRRQLPVRSTPATWTARCWPPGGCSPPLGRRRRPVVRALAHARIGELCLQAEPGEEACATSTRRCRSSSGSGVVHRGARRGGRWCWPTCSAARWTRRSAGWRTRSPGGGDDPIGATDGSRSACGRDPARARRRRGRPAAVAAGRPTGCGAVREHTEFGLWPLEVQAVAVRRPRPPRPARPGRRRRRRSCRDMLSATAARRAVPLTYPGLRRAAAGPGHGRPRPRRRGAGRPADRAGRAVPLPPRLPADHVRRARPRTRPSRPTGRRTPTRCRRTPAWTTRGCGRRRWRCCARGIRSPGPG